MEIFIHSSQNTSFVLKEHLQLKYDLDKKLFQLFVPLYDQTLPRLQNSKYKGFFNVEQCCSCGRGTYMAIII